MVLNVRGVPDTLITRLKMRGLICKCSLKDCVIAALTEWVDRHDQIDRKADEQRFQAAMGVDLGAPAQVAERELVPIDEA